MNNFYDELIKLKNLVRRGWQIRFGGDNIRLESDAEHVFSAVMLALKIVSDRKLDVNQEKLIKMLLFHDFGEIDAGDYTPIDNITSGEKFKKESAGVKRVSDVFKMEEITKLWHEFEENKTAEARLAKVVDKLDCVMQVKRYSMLTNKPEVYEEFLNNAKEIIKGYEEYLN